MTSDAELQCRTCRGHLVRLHHLAGHIAGRARSLREAARDDYRHESRIYLDHLGHDHADQQTAPIYIATEGGDAP